MLLFSIIINPNVDLIRMVPHEQREQFVRLLTERTVEGFFNARGIDTGVEYSYVVHHRNTDGEESPDQHNPHTHVVLPGTYYDADEGRRKPLYFSMNRNVNHIEIIHAITRENMAEQMDRYASLDWEQRYDELTAIQEQQEQIACTEDAHGHDTSHGPIWDGVRRTNEEISAVGFYGFFENREGKTEVQFRPMMSEMDHDEAELLAIQFKRRLCEMPEIEMSTEKDMILGR